MYADTIGRLFAQVAPQRITLGTLQFEEQSSRNRKTLVSQETGLRLLTEMKQMVPMLPPMAVPTGRRGKDGRPATKTSVGKFSYPRDLRVAIFRFVIGQIRRHFSGPVALCKETVDVWKAVGLDPRRCACVCQYGEADLLARKKLFLRATGNLGEAHPMPHRHSRGVSWPALPPCRGPPKRTRTPPGGPREEPILAAEIPAEDRDGDASRRRLLRPGHLHYGKGAQTRQVQTGAQGEQKCLAR